MNCDRYSELISADIDGELGELETSELRSHLDECPGCREKQGLLSRQNEALMGCRMPHCPDRLRESIHKKLGFGQPKRSTVAYSPYHMRTLARVPEPAAKPAPKQVWVMGPMGRA